MADKEVKTETSQESSVESTKKVSMDDLVKEVKQKKDEAKAIAEAGDDLNKENNIDQKKENKKEGVIDNPDRLLSTIGYISWLFILPLILKPESKECQFHGKQGLVITVFFLALWQVSRFFSMFWIYANSVVTVCHIALALYGMVHAFKGEKKKIPLFGDIAKMLNW